MSKKCENIPNILQYHFDQGEKTCIVYEEDVLVKYAAHKWIARFRSGNFDIKYAPRFGPPIVEKSKIFLKKLRKAHVILSHCSGTKH